MLRVIASKRTCIRRVGLFKEKSPARPTIKLRRRRRAIRQKSPGNEDKRRNMVGLQPIDGAASNTVPAGCVRRLPQCNLASYAVSHRGEQRRWPSGDSTTTGPPADGTPSLALVDLDLQIQPSPFRDGTDGRDTNRFVLPRLLLLQQEAYPLNVVGRANGRADEPLGEATSDLLLQCGAGGHRVCCPTRLYGPFGTAMSDSQWGGGMLWWLSLWRTKSRTFRPRSKWV